MVLFSTIHFKSCFVIYKAYKEEDAKVKREFKKSQEYKDATEMQKNLLKEYGFSEFAFKSEAIKFAKHFACVTNTKVAAISVVTPMWTAFDKMLFGNGKIAHFKKYDTWTSIVSDNKTGIRIVDANNLYRFFIILIIEHLPIFFQSMS